MSEGGSSHAGQCGPVSKPLAWAGRCTGEGPERRTCIAAHALARTAGCSISSSCSLAQLVRVRHGAPQDRKPLHAAAKRPARRAGSNQIDRSALLRPGSGQDANVRTLLACYCWLGTVQRANMTMFVRCDRRQRRRAERAASAAAWGLHPQTAPTNTHTAASGALDGRHPGGCGACGLQQHLALARLAGQPPAAVAGVVPASPAAAARWAALPVNYLLLLAPAAAAASLAAASQSPAAAGTGGCCGHLGGGCLTCCCWHRRLLRPAWRRLPCS
jgi:hypothetical protein